MGVIVIYQGIVIAALLCLSSCQFFRGTPPLRAAKADLTESYAQLRKKNISDLRYNLQVDLTQKDSFQGQLEVDFSLLEPFYMTLDFTAGEVFSLIVNGEPVTDLKYNSFFIEIPEALQQVGSNKVIVKYSHPYNVDGTGLHRDQDPVDKNVYMYTNFEPYNANQFFPCFDQPNLKATYRSKVLVPKGWTVVSSVLESDVEEIGENRRWIFPESPRFSTYTYSVHAGPYRVWQETAKARAGEIPLRLMSRQSMARYIDPEEWFGLTRSGFKFFESYFSSRYPYGKYDQLIVPGYSHGAMENVAAVTFSEDRFVSKGVKTHDQKRRLALTLYHEMAHMWFGNLVTMDWWNDLWLNESFATFSSYVGVSKLKAFNGAWSTFNRYAKQSAYRLDKSTTTHPIATGVPSTDQAFAHFDAITYGKGASVLKQLSFYLGEKSYRKGLKSYFANFAEKNTTLNDFMSTMERVADKDLQSWRQRWIETPMVNDIEAHVVCRRGRIKGFEIYQTATRDQPMLRTHKTRVALLRKRGGLYKIHRSKDVVYSGGRTLVPSLKGELCPHIVYPNYRDYDYVTVTLDNNSLKNIESSLGSVDSQGLRGILWANVWQMVLDQKYSIAKYLEVVEFNGLGERNADILSSVLENVTTVLSEYYPRDSDDWENKRKIWVKFFEQAALTHLVSGDTSEDMQKVWFDFLTNVAESPEVLNSFARVLKKQKTDLSLIFDVDQDRRWQLVGRLRQFSHPGSLGLLAKERARDPSARGASYALYAEAVSPNLAKKKKILTELLRNKERHRFADLQAAVSGLIPDGDTSLKTSFRKTYYEVLKTLEGGRDRLFAKVFVSEMDPSLCDVGSYEEMDRFVKAERALPYGVVKSLKGLLFENKRCRGIRQILKDSPESRSTLQAN